MSFLLGQAITRHSNRGEGQITLTWEAVAVARIEEFLRA
jgi:hypothetical protein